jgi:hypothetical protein
VVVLAPVPLRGFCSRVQNSFLLLAVPTTMFPAIEWSFDLALLGQDFPTEFFSGSVEQGATTGHSSSYDSQVQILLQAMDSAAPFLQP